MVEQLKIFLIASMTADLATMSRRSWLETLSYLLEMVRLEPESAGSQTNGSTQR